MFLTQKLWKRRRCFCCEHIDGSEQFLFELSTEQNGLCGSVAVKLLTCQLSFTKSHSTVYGRR